MKVNLFRPITIGICLTAICSSNAWAVPSLQLDTVPGIYDPITQTTVATANPFVLRALIDASSIDITRNFYISAAITPNPGVTPSPNFGSFSINGNTYSSSSGMQYGIPPVDASIGNLPRHSIYPTWYAELGFSAVGSSMIAAYNAQDGSSGSGMLNYVDFAVDISGLLSSTYAVHFDLYTYDLIGNPLRIDAFAPFSHDAQSGGRSVPDGGVTAMLLGVAVMGLGALQKRLT
jgi:hypothetical protein